MLELNRRAAFKSIIYYIDENRIDPDSLLQLLLLKFNSVKTIKLRMNISRLGANRDISVKDARNIREKIGNKFPNISVHI